MKHFTVLSLLGCVTVTATANAECYMRSTTQTHTVENIQRVTDVRNWVVPFINDVESGKQCNVTFKVQILGRWYSGNGVHTWSNENITEAAGCSVALERGKQELVRDTASTQLQAAQVVVCSDEPTLRERSVQEGDLIRESMVKPNPAKPLPFAYNGVICKWFTEMDISPSGMYQWQGIICEQRPSEWRVINKF